MIDDYREIQQFLSVCKTLNIFTIAYQHSRFSKYRVSLKYQTFDKYIVWNEYFKKQLIKINQNYKGKIVINNFRNFKAIKKPIDYSKLNIARIIYFVDDNLDYKNFSNFYIFKKWISFTEFHNNQKLIIENYLSNTYDRGITALSVLALPICALCVLFNMRKTAFFVVIITVLGLCTFFNITALISFLIAFLLFCYLFFIKFFKKNTLLIFMFVYFSISPLFLGNLDYKSFSEYENELNARKNLLETKILDDYPLFYYNINNDKTHLGNELRIYNCCPFYKNAFTAFNKEDKKIPILLYGLNYYTLKLEEKIIHRRVIWSFSKEKILEKPFLGHGIFSSKSIGDQYKIINHKNKMSSAIPLHPHNSILQLWLELGVIGIILFYILLYKFISKIYEIKKINSQYAAFSLASLFQIFFIGQFSYGFWQTWWISVIFINILIYNILYKKLLQNV